MPKYRKKRFGYSPYAPNMFGNGVSMGLPMPPPPLYGMPLPPSMFVPPTFMKPQTPVPAATTNNIPPPVPTAPSSPPPEKALSKKERACLPYFDDEFSRTKSREPTDVVIIDFDRTLLGTPLINADFIGRESRNVLEFKLGSGSGWWQCRPVLKAAIATGQWDSVLLDIAREASENDSVVLVITTARQTLEIDLIEDALESQGIRRVDHFACSTAAHSTDEEEDDEHDAQETNGSSSNKIALDGWAKQVMLELLLESYEYLERIVVFDSNKGDRNKYSRAVSQFVRDGWLNAEAFYIADLVPKRAQLDNLLEQRQLVHDVLQLSNVPLEKSIVVIEWLHKLTNNTRISLATHIANTIGDGLLDRLFLDDITITKGSLPPDMRFLTSQRGKQWQWRVTGYKIENRILWLKLQNNSRTDFIKAARLVRGVEDTIVNFDDSLHNGTNEPTIAATASPIALPSLARLSDISVETVIFERRELRAQKKR